MEKYYALIKKNIVKHIIVADESFLPHIENDYDYIIDVTNIKRPAVDDSYVPASNSFLSNHRGLIPLPFNTDDSHLNQGTEEGFEDFSIKQYTIKYQDGFVMFGCKKFPAKGLLDVLHKLIIHKHDEAACFTAEESGPTDGKFSITWEEAHQIYNKLKRVKL